MKIPDEIMLSCAQYSAMSLKECDEQLEFLKKLLKNDFDETTKNVIKNEISFCNDFLPSKQSVALANQYSMTQSTKKICTL